ncbi:MAG: carboxy terminal-processing peptidase [Xanthomonadaceae bacterium]|nr:carboxy terminal-processing peptidase [Xanthomonadaceae bacterium]MDE1957780.1 carboxy terminal-processing peptidase [Xanthomonadaceae bacterium]MDE2176729.1 carboxy terminal-processing peptidase [Xanthomonadaceae bacterium]
MILRRLLFAVSLLLLLPVAQAQAPSCAAPGSAPRRAAAAFPLTPTPAQSEVAQLSARFLTRYSYEALPLDNAMSERVFKAYFDALDGEKLFFTQADVDRFASLRDGLDSAIWTGDMSGPFAIFNLYEQRVAERVAYARSQLAKGFDFNREESFDLDRRHAPWAKDTAALDDLWRKRVKNDWLRLKLAGQKDAEIRKTLDKRYANYLEQARELDGEDAFSTFMNAYAMANDPHTNYLGPRASENFDISMKLSLEGIGAVLERRDEYTQIREIVPGGPASRSKLQVGDRIVGVGQGAGCPIEDVVGWRLDDVVALIRGKKDTVVRLEVLPADVGLDGKHEIITMVRKKVTIEEQAAKKKIIDIRDGDRTLKIGVIDLPTFYQDFEARRRGDPNYRSATRDVARLLGELKQDKVDGVIVDLRNNGGGSLAEATELSGLFIGKGPIVQVRDNRGRVEEEDSDNGRVWDGPLAVLVNRGSASASEIFAAAIQDYGRGLIIGENTYGKGTVQNLVDLDQVAQQPRGKLGELKMTIAEFFRVNGGSTQLKGVTPDVVFPQTINPKDFGESSYDNALPWSQIKPADYKPVANLKSLLPNLLMLHDARVAKSPAWQLMRDELAEARQLQAQTTVSLDFAVRDRERKAFEATQAAFKAREKTVDATARLVAPAAGAATAGTAADDGLQANERPLKNDLAREKARDVRRDTMLEEAAHILGDEVVMLKGDPRLAAIVLPPHAAPLK